jgi:hypothetical protein
MKNSILITILIVLSISVVGSSQSIFRGGFIAGFNAAQLDGDFAAGYHKLGLNVGIRSTIDLGKRWELQTDIAFSQRGARTTQNEALVLRSGTLNYLEVPVALKVRDWKVTTDDSKTFYRAYLSVGLIYGRLFRASSNLAFTHASVLDRFSKNDFSYMAGVGYNFNWHLGISMRIARSFNFLYDPKVFPSGPNTALQGHYISFLGSWLF